MGHMPRVFELRRQLVTAIHSVMEGRHTLVEA